MPCNAPSAADENLAEWQPVEARRIERLARPPEQEIIEHALGAMGRHQHVVNDHVPASSGLQAGNLPGVDALVVPPRYEKDASLRWAAVACVDQGAEQCPVAMVAATRISPASVETKASLGACGLAGGHKGRTDQRGGVVAPNLVRGAIVEQRHEPRMHARNAIDPRGRHVAFGKRKLNLVKGVKIHLIAAPSPGLQHAEKTGSLH